MLLQWSLCQYDLFPFNFTIYPTQLLLLHCLKGGEQTSLSPLFYRNTYLFPALGSSLARETFWFSCTFRTPYLCSQTEVSLLHYPELSFRDCQCLEFNCMERMKGNSACLPSLFSSLSSQSKRININNHCWAWSSQNFEVFPYPAHHSVTGSEFSIPWLLQQGTAIKTSRAHFP